ncbi:hypothetical protein D3C78_836550 [compost metagenome]
MGREYNDRHSGLQLLDFDEQLHAIHLVHTQIADHQIDFLAPKRLQPFLPTFGGDNAVAFADQAHSQQLQQAGIVIHQQEMGRFATCHGFTSSCFEVSLSSSGVLAGCALVLEASGK